MNISIQYRRTAPADALDTTFQVRQPKAGKISLKAACLMAIYAGMSTAVHAQQQDQQLEEIQITGSRITRTTMETPTPVTTVSSQELSNMAPGNLIDGSSTPT